jgi:opacity protein-like surface antigen
MLFLRQEKDIMNRTRGILSLIVLFLLSTASLFAQSERKPELFFGYSNLQAQGLADSNGFFNNRATLHGFDTAVTPFFGDRFGITGDFSFNENGQTSNFSNGSDSVKTDVFYFMGGPTVNLGNSGRLQPFARFLAGGAHTRFNVSSERTAFGGNVSTTFKTGTTDFALGIGGGLDWRLNDAFKVRLFQFDYVPVFLSNQSINTLTQAGALEPVILNGQRMDNYRFSVGIVF